MKTRNGFYIRLTVGHLGADDSSSGVVGGSDSNFADACDTSGENGENKNAPNPFLQLQR